MLQLKGKVLIKAYDSRTGKQTWEREQTNLIPNNTLLDVLTWGTTERFTTTRVSISTQNTTPSASVSTVNQIIGTGYVPSGTTSPTYDGTTSPPYGEIFNRIDQIGTPRTFDTIALTTLASANSQASVSATAYAYLLLSLSCTQDSFEFLDIYYRIEFVATSSTLPQQAITDFGKALFTVSFRTSNNTANFRMDINYPSFCKKPTASYTNLTSANTSLLTYYGWSGFGPTIGWTSGTRVDSHYKWKMTLSQSYGFAVGRILNLMLNGLTNDGLRVYTNSQFVGKLTPIQNGFWQKSASTTPFFDINNFGSDTGKVVVTESPTWSSKFPEIYKFTIGTAGATGVATYKFSVRKFLGFNGNTWTDVVVGCPFRNTDVIPNPGFHGWKSENNDVLRFSDSKIIQYDLTGITLLDLVDGSYQHWDSTTTPALAVTNLRQCATDGTKIYAGCRDTGLYEINVGANTVTQLSPLPCYGVDVGNGKVWAILNGRLANSDGWGVTVTFSYTGISDGNWSRAQFLKADPSHINHRLGMVASDGSTNYRVVWWDSTLVGGAATTGLNSSDVRPFPASMDVSDTGGFWALRTLRLNYGATSTQVINAAASQSLTHSVYGTDTYYKVNFYNNFFIASDRIVDSSNTSQNTFTSLGTTSFNLHLAGGITLFGDNKLRQLFTDNTYAWDNYGWNGAAWEKGHAGFRTTHTTDQALVSGLQVKFQNGASTPHFNAGDFLVLGVCNGLLKDSATTLYYEAAWYTKDLKKVTLINQTIPASAPHQLNLEPCTSDGFFFRMETDSPTLQAFTINGSAIATLYVNGEVPAPNEVTINASGVATFNAADAGKTFGGTATYLAN